MKRVIGFNDAKPLLTRQTFPEIALPATSKAKIRDVFGEELTPDQVVEHIIADVRSKGDKALFDYTERLDGVKLSSLEVSREEIGAAYQEADEELVSALKLAAERIRTFHLKYQQKGAGSFRKGGLAQWFRPLDRVGIYVPGGATAYPSTALMTAIPARVAGVREIIMTTPPKSDGSIPVPTLIAGDIAKVDRIFKIGGAQAVAALAFGTKTIPKVDKICGPGNIFVVLAKKKVYGIVDIDGLQGPSEIVIVADNAADPYLCAVDLLAQAEHDPLAWAILITTSLQLADKVAAEIDAQVSKLGQQAIATQALSKGIIAVVDNLDEAIELVNLFAPEHLFLMVKNAKKYINQITNAGGIFVGSDSAVAMGDYIAGPSHVLPTGGSARFSSPLGVKDFVKATNIISLNKITLKKLGQAAITIAKAEGLPYHARSVEVRLKRMERDR